MTVFLPPWSRNLRKHGDSQMVFQICMLALSLLFYARAIFSDSPVMHAVVYGDWATKYPAEWWAEAIMAVSTTYIVGILINGNWRWSPILRVAGSGLHVIILAAFARGAGGAIYGDFFVLICIVIGGAHIWFLMLNLGDLARSLGGRFDR